MYKNKTPRGISVHVPMKTRTHTAKVGAGDWATADAGTEGGAALVCVAYKGDSSVICILVGNLSKYKDITNQPIKRKQRFFYRTE